MIPIKPIQPGVPIQGLPSEAHVIVGATTSQTAFIDCFQRGPLGEARSVSGAAEFERTYGGQDVRSEASYQIPQFFLNGGSVALVVRVAPGDAEAASVNLSAASATSTVQESRLSASATNPGSWGNTLRVAVSAPPGPGVGFSLTVQETAPAVGVISTETFADLSLDAKSAKYCVGVVNASSELVRLTDLGDGFAGPFLFAPENPPAALAWQALQGGLDGVWDGTKEELSNALISEVTAGTASLSTLAPNSFNVLCLPATATLDDTAARNVMLAAQQYCEVSRAFYLIDIPDSGQIPDPQTMVAWLAAHRDTLRYDIAAMYYPRLKIGDALNGGSPREVASSGTIAGLYASVDRARGVWKAPAGIDCALTGAAPVYTLQDAESGLLNPAGINAIRTFPDYGVVSWGSRTLQGTDESANEWKYIPVRRTALYLEDSLTAGLAWVVFEPNAPQLWSAIVLSVDAFLNGLYRRGAFQGVTANEAYFVRCDSSTTTQAEVDQGLVNVVVGFAPLKPAEFVILQIQQHAACPPSLEDVKADA